MHVIIFAIIGALGWWLLPSFVSKEVPVGTITFYRDQGGQSHWGFSRDMAGWQVLVEPTRVSPTNPKILVMLATSPKADKRVLFAKMAWEDGAAAKGEGVLGVGNVFSYVGEKQIVTLPDLPIPVADLMPR